MYRSLIVRVGRTVRFDGVDLRGAYRMNMLCTVGCDLVYTGGGGEIDRYAGAGKVDDGGGGDFSNFIDAF